MVVVRDAEGTEVWGYDTRGADKRWRIETGALVVVRWDSEGKEYVLATHLLKQGDRVSEEAPSTAGAAAQAGGQTDWQGRGGGRGGDGEGRGGGRGGDGEGRGRGRPSSE